MTVKSGASLIKYKSHSLRHNGEKIFTTANNEILKSIQNIIKENPDEDVNVFGLYQTEDLARMVQETMEFGMHKDSFDLKLPSTLRDLSEDNNSLSLFMNYVDQLAQPDGSPETLRYNQMGWNFTISDVNKKIFIDGKSFDQISKETGKKEYQIVADFIRNKNQILEVANMDSKGEIQIKRFDVDFRQVKPRESYSRFRRALDFMKIWKINPNRDYEKAVEKASKPEEMQKRHSNIRSSWTSCLEANAKTNQKDINISLDKSLDKSVSLEKDKSIDLETNIISTRTKIKVSEANHSNKKEVKENKIEESIISKEKEIKEKINK